MKRFMVGVAVTMLFVTLSTPACAAVYRGTSYSYNDYGEEVPAPASYLAERVLYGRDFGVDALSNPQDIYTDYNGALIADTGNNRVLVLDNELKCIRIIDSINTENGIESLSEPEGVFRSSVGEYFICDTGNHRIVRLNKEFETVSIYKKPDTELLADDFIFLPRKVAVDTAGSIYIVADGLYQGLAEYNSDGEFNGFFGSNKMELTVDVVISYYWKKLLSREQGQAMTRLIPIQYSNLFIDDKNFVYTVTSETDTSKNEVKKLSASGSNILRFENGKGYDKSDFGDLEFDYNKDKKVDSVITDVFVEDDGTISILDRQRGRVFQYDKNCQLLFIFGDIGTQKGTFSVPTAITRWNDFYAVLDSGKNSLTLFSATDYAKDLRRAVKFYNDGRYDESIESWEQLINTNCNLSIAYRGIGKSLLRQSRYKEALDYFDKGNDREGYSEALREQRKLWMRDNIGLIIIVVLTVYLLWRLISYICRRRAKNKKK